MPRTSPKSSAAFLGALPGMVLAGCAAVLDSGISAADAPEPPLGLTGCEADSYDFVGEGTLAGLGLDVATPVPPPEPNRLAMIWVTHDPVPFDRGPAGGPVEMTRMLCFEFADGSGGSEWPVDAAWEPPAKLAAPSASDGVSLPPSLLLLGLGVLLAVGVSVVAFRRRG